MTTTPTTTVPTTLNEAWALEIRGNALLEFALTLPESELSAEQLVAILVYEFPERDAEDKDPLTWIPTVLAHGASQENIEDLVSQVILYDSSTCQFDVTTRKCEAFVRFAHRHDTLVTRAALLKKALERIAEHNPEFILRHFRIISENAGESVALEFARRACNGVGVISTFDEVETIMRMPLEVRTRVALRAVSGRYEGAIVPPVRNLPTAYLVIQVLVSGGCGRDVEDLEYRLLSSLRWKKGANDIDQDRAVRIFRWYLKYLEEVPVEHEPWMGRYLTPQGARERAKRDLIAACRAALTSVGFRFERIAVVTNPRTGREQREVRFKAGSIAKVYVSQDRGHRDERPLRDGDEVIVPDRIPGETLFRRPGEMGWLHEFHPVGPPSPAMVKQTEDNSWNF